MPDLDFLPEEARAAALRLGDALTEIRLRAGRPVQLSHAGGDVLCCPLDRQRFGAIISALMRHSLYACQDELDMGYFTLSDGSRVGIGGRFSARGPRSIMDISSACIRIAREIPGCADEIMEPVKNSAGTLIISPPGMGKTTMLRDIARQLSDSGKNVCMIDERGELAACRDGVPALDVGMRTDVISGCMKSAGIMLAIRSCAPDVIITDEIGGDDDGYALMEAARCGVAIIASAHGASLDTGCMREQVKRLVHSGIFDLRILLGPNAGQTAGMSRGSE